MQLELSFWINPVDFQANTFPRSNGLGSVGGVKYRCGLCQTSANLGGNGASSHQPTLLGGVCTTQVR